MPTTTLEITTTTTEIATETTTPKVEIETTTEPVVEEVIDKVPFIRGLDSSGGIQSLTTNFLVFAILVSNIFLRNL